MPLATDFAAVVEVEGQRRLLGAMAAAVEDHVLNSLWPSEAHSSLKLVYEFQRNHWPVLKAGGANAQAVQY
ncbi:hypothetical protein PLESTF_001767000 [Pleodorina starrii]|nr:hypothetical protein PLESTF_001767000 [Pleodorina starrii]